jgi:two-component system, cell cycle sensor histidine kinase and response regulator CckA
VRLLLPPGDICCFTILVVDDEPTVRAVTARALTTFGFDVLEAEDGRAAVELFARRPAGVVCVLLDMTMPRLDGEGAFRAIRALDACVPILLLSGYGDEHVIERLGEDGLSGFVQKPYRIADLREALRSVLTK